MNIVDRLERDIENLTNKLKWVREKGFVNYEKEIENEIKKKAMLLKQLKEADV